MKHIVGIFVAAMILLLTGCASVPMATIDQDAKAKEFSPAPSKASLYIYRSHDFGLEFIPLTVLVNGKDLGQTAVKTYFWLNVMPGKYNVASYGDNVVNLPLSVEAGKNYFVWQIVKRGVYVVETPLKQVDENTGRSEVMEAKLIASSVSGNDLMPLDKPMPAPSSHSVSQRLRELQDLRKDGIITEDEFQKKKLQLLEKL